LRATTDQDASGLPDTSSGRPVTGARAVTDPRPVRTLHLVTALEARPIFLRERISSLVIDPVGDAVRGGAREGARLIEL